MNGYVKNGVTDEKVLHIKIGQPVTANTHGEQFNLTCGKKYNVVGYNGCVIIKNDIGDIEEYSLDYFDEFNGYRNGIRMRRKEGENHR